VGSHTYADQIARINDIWITALQIYWLHWIHVVYVDSSIDWIVSMPHIESVIS